MRTNKTTTTTTKTHTPRKATTAPRCSRCGRQNTHGKDCRNLAACKSRRRHARRAARA